MDAGVPSLNTQSAGYPDLLARLVDGLVYRPDWTFALVDIDRGQGSVGLTLRILITCADTYRPDHQMQVWHYMPVPPAAYDKRSWRRWLLEQIFLVERHEACEFFQIDGERPYAPHHGPGNDPYIVFDHGTDEERRTDYLGVVRETAAVAAPAP